MYYTYILLSKKINKTYVGATNNLERRLKEHNSGESKFTKQYQPWTLFYSEEYQKWVDARKREKYLKSCAGRKFIKKLFNNDPV
jgi:putative endonuclease